MKLDFQVFANPTKVQVPKISTLAKTTTTQNAFSVTSVDICVDCITLEQFAVTSSSPPKHIYLFCILFIREGRSRPESIKWRFGAAAIVTDISTVIIGQQWTLENLRSSLQKSH
jgi:hypothetical protein